MNKIIIKVLPAEGSNPDFAPDQELQEGIECAGAALLAFDEDGDLKYTLIHDLSGEKIQQAIMLNKNEESVSLMRQAFVIAEAYIKASEMFRNSVKLKSGGELLRALAEMIPDQEDDENEP